MTISMEFQTILPKNVQIYVNKIKYMHTKVNAVWMCCLIHQHHKITTPTAEMTDEDITSY